MVLPQRARAALSILLLLVVAALPGGASAGSEIDATALVTRVIDGDTFVTDPLGRVRLVDIDAPELGQPGAAGAMAYLISLVYRQRVYLDLDDQHVTDRYGRLVAVTYVRHNATHFLNVNKAPVDAGHVRVRDFPNEFDPVSWSLYIYHSSEEPSGVYGLNVDQAVGMTVLVASFIVGYLTFPRFRKRETPVRCERGKKVRLP